jgi:fructose-1,6-bisphosphatase/inositol monophosphatase family enzyme
VPNVIACQQWLAKACHVNTLGSCRSAWAAVAIGVFPNGEPEHNVAGAAVAQRLGLAVTDVEGNAVDWRADVMPALVIGRSSVHAELLNEIRRANG